MEEAMVCNICLFLIRATLMWYNQDLLNCVIRIQNELLTVQGIPKVF